MPLDLHARVTQIPPGDDRYSRDRRRYQLALRMLERDVRTSIISEWTGLTHSRIRSLWKTQVERFLDKLKRRRRGKPPFDVRLFLRSSSMRAESTVVAGLCMATGLIPAEAIPNRQRFSSISRGELLCTIFDLYCALSPNPDRTLLSMEHVVLLVVALVKRDELMLGVCEKCEGLIVRDRLSVAKERCGYCRTLTTRGVKIHQNHASATSESNTRDSIQYFQSELFGEALAGSSA